MEDWRAKETLNEKIDRIAKEHNIPREQAKRVALMMLHIENRMNVAGEE